MAIIKVSDKTWRELNARKYPGESFDEVINRISLEFPKINREDEDGKS